jgi:hypothetical protein
VTLWVNGGLRQATEGIVGMGCQALAACSLALDHLDCFAAAIVGELGSQVQTAGVDSHQHLFTLEVVGRLCDGAIG